MQFITIQDEDSLASYCHQANQAKYLAIDTEFVRTRTLFPKLGLVQIFDGKQLALIDPTTIDDLSPFWDLLSNQSLLKLLHACSEDLEVFLTQGNCKPANLLDTQLAMSFLGHGLSMGYAAMVKHYRSIELDKSESRTDWLKRPLSQRQLEYAAADVYHLWYIGEQVLAELRDSGWLDAALEESSNLIEKKFRPVIPDQLYKDLKGGWRLPPAKLAVLKHLCEWRYKIAVKRDVPISFVAKDATLLVLADKNPKSVGAMANIRDIEILDVRHQGKAMLAELRKCASLSEEELPNRLVRLDDYAGYKQVFKEVKNIISVEAESHGLVAEFLASKKQINHYLSRLWGLDIGTESNYEADLSQGWRQTIVGNALQSLLDVK